jgi:D-sedoheptulose 7-phosphate isomerase
MVEFKLKVSQTINESIELKKNLLDKRSDDIIKCGEVLAGCLKNGGKILFCGNGGSAADSQHLAAELVVRLRSHVNRPALPAIALTVDTSILTAGGNDIGFDNIFAREVEAYGKEGDILVGISTSGVSPNVLKAVEQAKKQGMKSVCLLGKNGGPIAPQADFSVIVPSEVTARIQECHIMIGHIWCEMIEEILFPVFFDEQ